MKKETHGGKLNSGREDKLGSPQEGPGRTVWRLDAPAIKRKEGSGLEPKRGKPKERGLKMAVIIMDGPEAIYAGFADPKEVREIIKMLEDKNRRIPTQ